MADYLEKEGPSVEEAVDSALMALGLGRDEAQVQVLGVAKSGRAKVRVARLGVELPPVEASDQPVPLDPVYVKPAGQPFRERIPARYASDGELEALKAKLEEMLGLMQRPSQVETVERLGFKVLNIRGEHEAVLIGKRGSGLQAIQVLATEFANKGLRGEKVQVQVDVAGYRARQEDKLMADALSLADQALSEGRQLATGPLTAADRRVVHLALKDRADVETFSVGEGEFKRVVIQKKE